MTDVTLIDAGSVVGLKPETPEAAQWLDDNVLCEEWMYLGEVLYVDNRSVLRIIEGMNDYGLVLAC